MSQVDNSGRELNVFVADWVKSYETYFAPFTAKFAPECAKAVRFDEIRRYPTDSLTILDAATGTGAVAFYVASLAPGLDKIIATDNSKDMLDMLNSKAKAQGVQNIKTELADLTDMSCVPSESCDVAIVSFGIFFVPDAARPKAWKELARILKPNGVVCVSVWKHNSTADWLVQSTLAAFPDFDVSKTNFELAYRLANDETTRKEMEDAGFANVEIENIRHESELPRDKFISLIVNTPILKANVPDEEKRAAIVAAGEKRFNERCPADAAGYAFEGTAGIVRARRV